MIEAGDTSLAPTMGSEAPTIISLGEDVIDVADATRRVTHASCGAVSSFIGTTRDTFHGRRVARLDYEAYAPMAIKELHKIAAQIRQQWPSVWGICMRHRLGRVPVAETSVLIAVSSPHRIDAILAVHFAIDTLKQTVPVWKREVYEDGGSEWKANCEGCKHSRNVRAHAPHTLPDTVPCKKNHET